MAYTLLANHACETLLHFPLPPRVQKYATCVAIEVQKSLEEQDSARRGTTYRWVSLIISLACKPLCLSTAARFSLGTLQEDYGLYRSSTRGSCTFSSSCLVLRTTRELHVATRLWIRFLLVFLRSCSFIEPANHSSTQAFRRCSSSVRVSRTSPLLR